MTREIPQAVKPHFEDTKVRLRYQTSQPTTEDALFLVKTAAVAGPFTESIYVILAQNKVYNLLEAFEEPFAKLKDVGVVPADAKLTGYEVLFMDGMDALAYVLSDNTKARKPRA